MSDEKVLTKEIAEEFVEDDDSVDLKEFTAIEDEAAESLSTHEGRLAMDLDELPESAAEILRQHPSFQDDDEDWDDDDE